MVNLYDRIHRLCEENEINVTQMCKESGVPRSSLSDLKVGRKSTLSPATLTKISNRLGVSVDYLLGIDLQAGIDDCRKELSDCVEAYHNETDESARFELAVRMDALQSSLDDQIYAKSMSEQNEGKKNKPAAESDRLEVLEEDERVLLDSYRTMTDNQKQMMQTFLRGIKNAD